MTRFAVSLLRLATLAFLGTASSIACAQATIDQNKALAGNITPGDTPGFPITISVPGHYKLMGNLNVPAGSAGIRITAPNVTLDLNGFTVRGPGTCSWSSGNYIVTCSQAVNWNASGIEIYADGDTVGAVVRNGTVRGFAGAGIYGAGQGDLISEIHARENAANGIGISPLGAGGAVVRNAFVEFNGQVGIAGARLIVGSVSQRNGNHGIFGVSTVVHESYVVQNRGHGVMVMALRGTSVGLSHLSNVGTGTSMGGNLVNGVPF